MTKLFTTLFLAAFAFSAQAASHAGGGMKEGAASAAKPAKPAASAAKKADKKEMKKEEAKK